ncbi:TOBE domain-containing protein, partial [Klebsiella pneumoniae]
TLSGGETLCSTLNNQEVDNQQLKLNDSVTALFNADQVIIATLC